MVHKVVQEVKFLGIIFDHKLSFLPHIKFPTLFKAVNIGIASFYSTGYISAVATVVL